MVIFDDVCISYITSNKKKQNKTQKQYVVENQLLANKALGSSNLKHCSASFCQHRKIITFVAAIKLVCCCDLRILHLYIHVIFSFFGLSYNTPRYSLDFAYNQIDIGTTRVLHVYSFGISIYLNS